MTWTIEYTDTARKQLRKIDRQTAHRLLDYMDERVAPLQDPRLLGKPLTGPHTGFWRYRVGDHRIICHLQDEVMTVLVVQIGHRRYVYR